MNIQNIRDSFPFFAAYGKKHATKIYVDNAATTHKPQTVISSLTDFYTYYNANIHRGLYDLGEDATTLYEQAREDVARYIHAAHSEEIVFTQGTTESINFVAQAWACKHLKKNDVILLSQAEHHANLVPWQQVAQKTGACLEFIPLDQQTYYLDNPSHYLSERVRLVAITLESNVVGAVWRSNEQLQDFIHQAHRMGAVVLVDAAQYVAHHALDVTALDVDFLAFSGHKMYAPTGIGVLFIKKNMIDHVDPYQFGGSMVHSVSYNHAQWAEAPRKFEAGTPSVASAIGLGAACRFLAPLMCNQSVIQHEASLAAAFFLALELIPGVRVIGNCDSIKKQGHLVSFSVDGVHAHDLATFISRKGIAVRAGHLCAQPLMSTLGVESVTRVSFAMYNQMCEIDDIIEAVTQGIKFLKTL